MNNIKLDNTLESGKVVRYHCAPTVRPQTVAQHSWNVAVLALYITDNLCSRNLLLECLLHDTGEYVTGDVPFTLKRDHPQIRAFLHSQEFVARQEQLLMPEQSLTVEETAVLKVCDTLDGLIWCVLHEERHGPVHDRWHQAYEVAREKFGTMLSEAEWVRADGLFRFYRSFNNPTSPT